MSAECEKLSPQLQGEQMGKKEVAGQILTLMVGTALESFHCEGVNLSYAF